MLPASLEGRQTSANRCSSKIRFVTQEEAASSAATSVLDRVALPVPQQRQGAIDDSGSDSKASFGPSQVPHRPALCCLAATALLPSEVPLSRAACLRSCMPRTWLLSESARLCSSFEHAGHSGLNRTECGGLWSHGLYPRAKACMLKFRHHAWQSHEHFSYEPWTEGWHTSYWDSVWHGSCSEVRRRSCRSCLLACRWRWWRYSCWQTLAAAAAAPRRSRPQHRRACPAVYTWGNTDTGVWMPVCDFL